MAERLSYTTYYEPPRRTATIQRLEDQVRRLEARLDRERLRNKRLRERLLAERLSPEEKAILARARAQERSRLQMIEYCGEDDIKYA